ncbi:hypothetical protein B6U83_00140 [Thermoplasmatales archaeon ex4484_36]|nr:MAG: hypothetical protein B6U83_00140 [Thermoplasmatales archaeon ex4484_36]
MEVLLLSALYIVYPEHLREEVFGEEVVYPLVVQTFIVHYDVIQYVQYYMNGSIPRASFDGL